MARGTSDISVIGSSTKVTGRVSGEGGLRVEGAVKGDVAVTGPLEVAEGSTSRATWSRIARPRGALLGESRRRGQSWCAPERPFAASSKERRSRDRARLARCGTPGVRIRARPRKRPHRPNAAITITERKPSSETDSDMAGTVIGEGLTIEGEVTSEEEVVVHGTVRGTLKSSDVVERRVRRGRRGRRRRLFAERRGSGDRQRERRANESTSRPAAG